MYPLPENLFSALSHVLYMKNSKLTYEQIIRKATNVFNKKKLRGSASKWFKFSNFWLEFCVVSYHHQNTIELHIGLIESPILLAVYSFPRIKMVPCDYLSTSIGPVKWLVVISDKESLIRGRLESILF